MGIQNDRLKGEFYRVPMTKLASRTNVIAQINDLIEYFNGLSDLVDNTFDRITVDRERMKNILTQINNKTRHFKYIIENFEPEISQHVEEKLANLMGTLSTNLNTIVTEYNRNLFNHKGQTDSAIADDIQDLNSLEEWDRSINHISNSMGIRWFGGKLSDKFFINQFNSVLTAPRPCKKGLGLVEHAYGISICHYSDCVIRCGNLWNFIKMEVIKK